MKSLLTILAVLLLLGFPACETDDSVGSSNSSVVIKEGFSDISRYGIGANSIKLVDGWTLLITPQTKINRLRPSCSGFDTVNISQIDSSDTIAYEITLIDSDLSSKSAIAITVSAYREGCLNDPQYILDTDKDGYTDNIDNCPTVFNPDQADANNDGIGDACSNP
jgi:hypothetical protein